MEITFDYTPTERQARFHQAPERFKLYGGAVGGGKSVALCAEGILLSLEHPGNRGYLARETYEALRKTTLLTFFDICPPKLIKSYNKTEHLLQFINGSQIQFGDLEDENKLKSLNLGWFGIDEASETTRRKFMMLASRLRLNLPNIHYYGLLATNPAPGWIKDDFIDHPDSEHIFVPALPTDNPYLPDDYVERLIETSAGDEEWVKRYLQGSWATFEGQIYKEFNRLTHVIKPFEIPKHWYKYRSIDFGEVNPTACVWIAVDDEQNIYIYREYYQPSNGVITTEQHAEKICLMTGKDEILGTVADSHALGKQLIIDYNHYGVRCQDVLEHEVLTGIARVRERLRLKENRKPSLFIFDTCEQTIREFEEYRWDQRIRNELDPKEKPLKVNDHIMDCIRNFVMKFYYVKPLSQSDYEERETRKRHKKPTYKVSQITGY